MACWKPPNQYGGAYSAASSVLGALLRLGRFGRNRIVRRRFLGVASRFFVGLWLLLLLLLLDVHFVASEMAKGIGCAGAERTLSTLEAP